MVKLVYTHASGACGRKLVEVQVLSPARRIRGVIYIIKRRRSKSEHLLTSIRFFKFRIQYLFYGTKK